MFDNNGKLIIPTLSENMDAYQKLYKDIFGLVDIDPSSGLGSDLAITAEMKKIADEFLQNAIMQNSPYEAIGQGLENLCFLRGIKKKLNEHSVVLVEFSGADDLLIPKDTIITNSLTDETFKTNEQGLISGGVFSVYATSSEAGRVVCDANTITLSDLGDVSVNNPSDGILGYLKESDTDLRIRLLNYSNGLNVDEELFIKLSNLHNVKNIKILPNPELTQDSNGIPPKQTAIVILGGDNASIAKEITQVYPSDKKTFGEIIEVVSSSITGNTTVVSFSRPLAQGFLLNVIITTDETFNSDNEGVIRSSILNYVMDKFTISKDVLIDSLYIPVQQDYNNNHSPFRGIKKVLISLDGSDQNKEIAYNAYGVLSSDDLIITIN